MSNKGKRPALLFFYGLLCVFMLSCAAKREIGPPPVADVFNIKRVAVLPFANMSAVPDAGDVVAGLFVTELFRTKRFYVEEPGNIVQFIGQERMSSIGEIEMEKLRALCNRLNLDAAIVGTVEEFDDGRSFGAPTPVVSVTARMVEPREGKIIWSAQNKKKGSDYSIAFDIGRVRTVTALAKKVVSEMVGALYTEKKEQPK